MKIEINDFVPFAGNSKAFKGKFEVCFAMEDVKMRIMDCQFFNNGEKVWVNFPDKKKQVDGKWQHDYSLVEIETSDGNPEKSKAIMKEIAEKVVSYLKSSSNSDFKGA